MVKVVIYSKANCPFCDMAKNVFDAQDVAFEEIRVDLDPNKLQEMITRSQRRTVPEIFINDQHIGGYDDLAALIKSGKLQELLNPQTK